MLHDQDSFLVYAIYNLHINVNIYLHLYNFIQFLHTKYTFYKINFLEFLFELSSNFYNNIFTE